MSRGPLGRRYWSSLTGLGDGPIPERNWRGQPFWRRYVASFFVLPQPPGQPGQSEQPAPEAGSVSVPHRVRSPRTLRFQAAFLAGAAVLVAVVVSVSHTGSPSSGGPPPPPVGGGTSTPEPSLTTTTGGPSTPTTSPSKSGPWHGTIRVTMNGEHVTAGPTPGAGLVFGLAVGSQSTLVGPGNLVLWTDDKTATAASCTALLQAHAVYQVPVQVGDQLCMASLNGRAAFAKVTAEDQNASDGSYIDLDVLAFAAP